MATFKPDPKGIGEMLVSPMMLAAMGKRAEAVRVRAEATAPVDTNGPHPGRYKEAFSTETLVKETEYLGHHNRRACGRVSNDAPEAHWVEWGSKNNPRHRTLGKALDALNE